jgi:hypothetical protein
LLWRATGRRVDFDYAVTRFPIDAWNAIFLLDSLFEKMFAQKTAKEKPDGE